MSMISTLVSPALASVAAHPGWGPGWGGGGGPGWVFILVPFLWVLLIALLIGLFSRRWRRSAPPWVTAHGPGTSAESTLAERFAQGDIDETEYRARLEVIRANNPDQR
ncbi:hypothetical protein D9V29_00080 [Mycetocola manganoxydans]|uniref:SHOCT domain-containing protein n=2 Tax=Mycetocola manganoxydans TaxID=699879 RepID=A0A3L7A158_9MICO|nr:hypothetical protein D9V29_00080 [Mycetocola manganoxydans]